MKFTFKSQELKSALKFCTIASGKNQVRYYLEGIYFEKKKNKPLYLVATDGHRMHTIELKSIDIDKNAEFNFIMPSGLVKQAIRFLGKGFVTIDIGVKITLDDGNISFGMKPIDGKYPEWQKVLPKKNTPKKLEDYNAKFLCDSFKAFSQIVYPPYVSTYGEAGELKPVVIKARRTTARAIIMPVRGE